MNFKGILLNETCGDILPHIKPIHTLYDNTFCHLKIYVNNECFINIYKFKCNYQFHQYPSINEYMSHFITQLFNDLLLHYDENFYMYIIQEHSAQLTYPGVYESNTILYKNNIDVTNFIESKLLLKRKGSLI